MRKKNNGNQAISLAAVIFSVKFGSVLGLQEDFYIFLGIEDFAVKPVVWDYSSVAVILRGASAYSEQLRQHGIGNEPLAVEQRMVFFPKSLAHGGDIVGLCDQPHYARISGGYCFFHCPAPFSFSISRAMSLPLNCESLPIWENPILPRSFSVCSFLSEMWR